jgi:Bacterial regulatory proteins, luxR family
MGRRGDISLQRALPRIVQIARDLSGTKLTWWPEEDAMAQRAIAALANVLPDSGIGAIGKTLLSAGLPFEASLLEVIQASSPYCPVNMAHGLTEDFATRRARHIQLDPAPLVAIHLKRSTAASDLTLFPEYPHLVRPYADSVYPAGLTGVSGLILDVAEQASDTQHVGLYLFRDHDDRDRDFRMCRMLERLHPYILAAFKQMRLPFMGRESLDFQRVASLGEGYALVRSDGTLFEWNHAALMFTDAYTGRSRHEDRTASLVALLRRISPSFQGDPIGEAELPHPERWTSLRVVRQPVLAESGKPSELTLFRMQEFSHLGLARAGVHCLAELTRSAPRQGEVLRRWLAGWSARKISSDLGITVATVRAIQESIKIKLNVRRDEGPLEARREITDKLRAALNSLPE